MYNILEEQKKYLENVTSIPISGLSMEDWLKIPEGSENPAKDVILKIPGVHSIEKSRERFPPERWSVIVQKDKEMDVIKEIGKKLGDIYKSQTGQTKMILTGSQEQKTNTVKRQGVITFAKVLQKKYASKTLNTDNKNMTNTGNKVNENMKEVRPYEANKNRSISTKHKGDPKSVETQQTNIDNNKTNLILKKLKEMKKKQVELYHAQTKLEQLQEDIRKNEAEKAIREETNTNERITNMINKKLEGLKYDYQTQLAQTEKKINNTVGTVIDKKIEEISVKVANQVAHTLIEAFMQRITKGNTLELNDVGGSSNIPLLTQEYVTPKKGEKTIMTEGTNSKTSFLKSIEKEKFQTTKDRNITTINQNRLHHDKLLEQDTMTE